MTYKIMIENYYAIILLFAKLTCLLALFYENEVVSIVCDHQFVENDHNHVSH